MTRVRDGKELAGTERSNAHEPGSSGAKRGTLVAERCATPSIRYNLAGVQVEDLRDLNSALVLVADRKASRFAETRERFSDDRSLALDVSSTVLSLERGGDAPLASGIAPDLVTAQPSLGLRPPWWD